MADETLVYRVNRIPDRLHVALLELLGMRLQPPTAARSDIRFRLAAPPDEEDVVIPAGETEVATQRLAPDEPVVFQVDDFTIPVARPVAYAVERDGKAKDVGVARGVASPKGADQLPFGTPPKVGDALYLGFDVPLGRLLLQVDVDCSGKGRRCRPRGPAAGVGGGRRRRRVARGRGARGPHGRLQLRQRDLELQLPDRSAPENIAGTRAHRLRCRLADRPRSGGEAIKGSAFTHPPEIYSITAAPIGGLVPASEASHETDELLGRATGRRARAELRYSPMLAPSDGERLEVLNATSGDWEPWDLVESFVESGPETRTTRSTSRTASWSGARRSGPPTGAGSSTGRFLRKGPLCASAATATAAGDAATSFLGHAHNPAQRDPRCRGGHQPAARTRRSRLRVARRRTVAGSARVPHPLPRCDGRRLRLSRPRSDSARRPRRVRPTRERRPGPPLHPASRRPGRTASSYEELVPTDDLYAEVGEYLDERRLIGTTVELAPMKLRGMSVVVNLQVPRTDVGRIEEEVAYALYTYLNPFVGGSLEGPGDGVTSAGRSTRESCTGSSMPFRASTT